MSRLQLYCALAATALILSGCDTQPAADDVANDATAHNIADATYARDIAPILFDKCAGCHHPGEAAPFSLLSFEDARRRASLIADVTGRRFMPPWQPKEGHGEFAGTRRLGDREVALFRAWANAGAPMGDADKAPAPPIFVEGWQLGTPDLVLESPAYKLAAGGGDVFRNFVVPTGLAAPRWISAIELRPTNPRVTHHARLGIDSSSESIRRDAADPEPGYDGMAWGQDPDGQLISWAPGMTARPGMPDAAWRLHPLSPLVLHTHMQPSGKPEVVQFRLGIHFAKRAPQVRPAILRIGSRDIDIPAGDANYTASDTFTLPVSVDVHFIFPHAHSLCREARVTAQLPGGSDEPLIWIEHFDENWHDTYHYAKPVRLPRGTKLVSRFAYDNSAANVRNRHHPPRRVVYGSNVDDEMADVYLQVTAVHADERAALLEYANQQELRSQLVGFRRTLAGRPNDPWSQEGLAACYFGLGQPREAIRVLEQRVAAKPAGMDGASAFPVASLGMAQLAAGDAASAERRHREALALDANYPMAWLGLGKALVALKRSDDAEQAFRRAVELAPGMSDAAVGLADLLMGRGRLEDAASACDRAIGAAPGEANLYLKLAEIRARQRRYDESLAHLEIARGLAPYTHPAKVLLAAYCFQSGDGERARTLLRDAYFEMPDHPVPALFLGQLARRDQKPDDARRYLTAAAAMPTPGNWPESHKRRFQILLQTERCQLAEQLQDIAMARDALTRWLEVEPENKQAREMLESLRDGHKSP